MPAAEAQGPQDEDVGKPPPDAPAASAQAAAVAAPTLPPITVIASTDVPASGRSVLAGKIIDTLPENNGNLNEMLRILPGVQLSDRARPSFKAGEIEPPKVSIAGGKVFQNNFTIDGMSNDSLLDPTFVGSSSQVGLPGHPQAIFLDTDIVERITVYDHNVPAEFGDFTGGVVDTRTREPGPDFAGSLHYRTTNERWTEFHVEDDQREDFENSRSPGDGQPEFEKHDAGLTLNLPLGETAGLLGSYQFLRSRIPLQHLDGERTERRQLENLFLKYSQALLPGDDISLTGIYAPYEEERGYKDAINGDYTIDKDAYQLSAEWRHRFDRARLKVLAGHRFSKQERDGAAYLTIWQTTESRAWGVDGGNPEKSFDGSPGPLATEQSAWQLRADLAFDEFATGPLRHAIKFGGDRQRIEGTQERSEDWLFSTASDFRIDEAVCPEGDPTCLPGEQYIAFQQLYPAGRVSTTMDRYRLYLEDRLRIGRLELRPGLRWSYDDFMRNHNLAPRLAASYDLFGNGNTRLIGGYNRYYGNVLFAYKLREISRRYFRTRIYLDLDWDEFKSSQGYAFSDLDTPYSDEAVLGLDQRLLGGLLKLRYIERRGKDEFAREYERDSQTYLLNNNGESRHREYRLSWERQWQRHFLSLNVTHQETLTTNDDYSDSLDADDLAEFFLYRGDFLDADELPREDFNRPWIGNLVYAVRLPYGLTFTNVTHYRSGYENLKDSREDIELDDGTRVDILDGLKKSQAWLFDWKIDWYRPTVADQALVLSLEVNNVFNRKLTVGDGTTDEFELGRQFWAGLEYYF